MQSDDTRSLVPYALQQGRKPIIFSVTELGDSLQRCETSWLRGSLNGFGLERPNPSIALALGSLIHYTMADWAVLFAAANGDIKPGQFQNPFLKPILDLEDSINSSGLIDQRIDPVSIFNRHFAQFKATTYERYEAWRGAEMSDVEWHVYEDEVGELGEAMITNYQRYYGTPYPQDCTLLSPELTIVRPLPKMFPRQRQFYLEGTLDLLLLDADGYLFPWDHKTYNDHPSEYDLKNNDQFETYCWLAGEEFPSYIVGGFCYNGWWKRKEITNRMRRKDGSSRDMSDLFHQEYLMYSEEQVAARGQIMAFRAQKAYQLMRRYQQYGPLAIDKSQWFPTCPGCSFNDVCKSLFDGDFGDWDAEAEADALADYVRRVKTPAWRVPVKELVAV